MIDAIVALTLDVDDRQPAPSRGAVRYMDSGARTWAGVPRWIRELSLCIRKHESIHAGHYKADNGTSSASGAYQMIQSTWTGNALHTKGAKRWAYRPASSAPAWVQDRVFIHSIRQGGIKAWKGTGCPGTS